jgi:ABC-type dipeptide/oligopeptide/nickel transport system permease component
MELGLEMPEFLFFLILSFFFCLFIILPSDAMQSAGFTIPRLFSSLLGEERFNFVEYHLRRTILTIFVHATLPFSKFPNLLKENIFSFIYQFASSALNCSSNNPCSHRFPEI